MVIGLHGRAHGQKEKKIMEEEEAGEGVLCLSTVLEGKFTNNLTSPPLTPPPKPSPTSAVIDVLEIH